MVPSPRGTLGRPFRHGMRILEIETFGRGGLTHYTFNLSLALAERGHEVTFVTAAGYELEARAVPGNLRVLPRIGRLGHRWRGRLPAALLSLVRKVEAVFDAFATAWLVRRLRPDVVHLHCTNPIVLAYLECLAWARRPVVATAHVVTPHEPIPWQGPIYRRIHRKGQRIIAHSAFDRRRLIDELAVDPQRVVVIPHGEYGFFDRTPPTLGEREAVRQRLGLESQDEVVLFFGFIREYKGLDLLFEAWPEVIAARPNARLVVAGDPVRLPVERRRELEDWATRLGAIHRFGYVPFDDVGQYFAAADLLVMPYRHISQSGVLYLALSLSLPVVATQVGVLPEMLRDGESAVLVPPESPSALAEGLIRALGDPVLRARVAAGGRAIAEDHAWPAIAERTERVFEALIEGHDAST